VGCRINHLGTSCAAAGPTGGDDNPADSTPGACGLGCDSFCGTALVTCPGTFVDLADCKSQCATFAADSMPFSTVDISLNDYGCRVYHLTVASSSAANATAHCPHIVAASPVCVQ
jgi:hypothetical protein